METEPIQSGSVRAQLKTAQLNGNWYEASKLRQRLDEMTRLAAARPGDTFGSYQLGADGWWRLIAK